MDENVRKAFEDLGKSIHPLTSPIREHNLQPNNKLIVPKKSWPERNLFWFSIIMALIGAIFGSIGQWLLQFLPQQSSR